MKYKRTESLYPFYLEDEVKRAIQYYIPTQCQNVAPLLEYEKDHQYAFVTKQPLLPFFTNKKMAAEGEPDKFYMILADAGMGKTTFMINLYFEYLNKFANQPYQIRLFPLGFPNIIKDIEKIGLSEKKNTILLLDAFDEDNEAIKDHHKRLNSIIHKVLDFREVVITCRTQFFPEKEEHTDETGILRFNYEDKEFTFHKIYLSPFDEKDIKKYLRKNYPFLNYFKRQRAEKIVKQSPNLMIRPMLLSYIDDLLKDSYLYTNSFQIYRDLVDRWLEREVRRKTNQQESYKKALYAFSQAAAVNMYLNQDERGGWFIPSEELEPFAKTLGIGLSDLELKSRSLLNLNALGQYKFAHKSILEYFLAVETFENPDFSPNINLNELELTGNFMNEMYGQYAQALSGKYCRVDTNRFKEMHEIKPSELPLVKTIILQDLDSQSLNTLRGFRNLKSIQIGDIKIAGTRLKELLFKNIFDMSNHKLINFDFFQNLVNIKELNLSQNLITDVFALRRLKNLTKLNLNNNRIRDISPLQNLVNLKHLDLSNNQIFNIMTLQNMKNLEYLDLSNNQITDISYLRDLKKIKYLRLDNNQIQADQLEPFKSIVS